MNIAPDGYAVLGTIRMYRGDRLKFSFKKINLKTNEAEDMMSPISELHDCGRNTFRCSYKKSFNLLNLMIIESFNDIIWSNTL